MITAAAVNASFETMINRMKTIILVAAVKGNKSLVFSTYGYSLFRNDPRDIAKIEKEL
jgi:hypothetical protein